MRLCTGRTAYRGSRGIALLFLDHGTRRGWGVSVTPRPLFTPGKDLIPIVQEAGWAPGPVWTGAENLAPTGIRSLDLPAHIQSLYRLRYPARVGLMDLQLKKKCRIWAPKISVAEDLRVVKKGGVRGWVLPDLSKVCGDFICKAQTVQAEQTTPEKSWWNIIKMALVVRWPVMYTSHELVWFGPNTFQQ